MRYTHARGLGGASKGTVVRRGVESEPPTAKEWSRIVRRALDKSRSKFWVLSPTRPDNKPLFDSLGMSPREITTEQGERIVYDRSELGPNTRVTTLEGTLRRRSVDLALYEMRLKDLPADKELVIVSREGMRAIAYTLSMGYPPPVTAWYAKKWGPLPAWAWLGGGTAAVLGLALLKR